MKKLTALVLALLMVLSIGAITAMAEEYVPGIYEITVDDPDPAERYLNVRAGLPYTPGYTSVLGAVWTGEQVEVIEVLNTDWGKIIYDGKEGYIRLKTYTTFISAAESEEPSEESSEEPSVEPVVPVLALKDGSTYVLENDMVKGVKIGTSVADLADDFAFEVKVLKNGEAVDAASDVGTGYKVVLVGGESEAVVVILGDVDGDGILTSTDYLKIKSYFLNIIDLDGEYFVAADLDANGNIDSTDYLKLKSYFLGLSDIYA